MRTSLAPIEVLDGVRITAAYQPIVDLSSGDVVAYEALARGPAGTPLASPGQLFDAARRAGAMTELDWACRAAAMQGALDAALPSSLRLFVNAEPAAMTDRPPAELVALVDHGVRHVQAVMELTERSLTADPAQLLRTVQAARRAGWSIALDDVGADPASLALMPFLEPDVIKLDLRLVQQRTDAEVASIVNAVLAESERSGAAILAEGIETEQHRQRALALGATLGQGWLFGRPGGLPSTFEPPRAPLTSVHLPEPIAPTPFSLIAERADLRVATKELLLPLSHHLERHALRAAEPPVLLAAFEDVEHFTAATRRRYSRLSRHSAFVAALGVGMPPTPVDGVRGARLADGDPLGGEWVVTCVGPHFAGALIARDLGDTGDDRQRRFIFTVTYDRTTVVRAARSLLAKVVPV